MKTRKSEWKRESRETRVVIALDLDSPSRSDVECDLPFLGHMLEAFAAHGRFGLAMEARGDVEVDPHHLMEDSGIALGNAIARALEGSGPVLRAGFFMFPMDGSLARATVDLCGRPNLIFKADLGEIPLGSLDPRLFRDFFKGLADALRATIHLEVLYKDNDHHAIEAVFKAFGRALAQAVKPAGGDEALSTKGVIDA